MKTVSRILKYVGKYKITLLFVIISALLSSLLSMLSPLLVGNGIDYIIGTKQVNFNGIAYIIFILILTYIGSSLFQWLMGIFINILSSKTSKDLRIDAFNKISILPLKYFDTNTHGDLISRVTNDVDAVTEGLLQGITQFFSGTVSIIGSFAFMLYLNPAITLVVLVITPLSFLIASFITKRSYKMFKQQSETLGELNGYIEEIIGNQKIVKAFSYENESQEVFKQINKKLYFCGRDAQFYSSLTNPSTRFINNIAYISVGVIGGLVATVGKLTVGNISSFLSYATQFAKPINEITGIIWQIQAALASAERIFAVIDEKPEKQNSKNSIELKNCKGFVKCVDVKFSYKTNVSLIENLNFSVRPGDTIAIVGPTGAGKTTIINLLMRFYDIDSGEILVDNINIKDITRSSLRNSFGMVLQESWLFSGTVKENIKYAKPNATDEEIINVAKSAHAHSFIEKLPNGYNSIITEDGGNLSQGQKQLLTIARAMLASPPMLILDEATSSVDTRTEAKIQEAFLNIMKGRTSFVIAHRLSTIRGADLILVMDKGKIVEQGTHTQLLANNGLYYKLYKSQFTP